MANNIVTQFASQVAGGNLAGRNPLERPGFVSLNEIARPFLAGIVPAK